MGVFFVLSFFFCFFYELNVKSKVFLFILFIYFCYVNFKLSRFLVNTKNGVFSFVVGRCDDPLR